MLTANPLFRRIHLPTTRIGSAIAVSAALMLSPAHAQNSKTPSLIMDELALDQPELGKIFNVAPKPVLKGVSKIAIPWFAVESAVKTGAGIRRESGEGSVTQNVTYVLDGVPRKEMQAAVDKLYDSLVSDLKAQGIEVVPVEQVIATTAYKNSAPKFTSPNLQEGGNAEAMVYAAKGLTLGLSNSRFIFNRNSTPGNGDLFSLVKIAGQLTSQVGDGNLAGAIGEELNVPVMVVQLPLEFVEQSTKSSGGGVISAEVHSRLRMSISSNAFFSVGSTKEYSSHVSIAPIILAGTPVKAVKDTSSVAANVGLGLLSMMTGSKSSTKLTEKTAEAHPTLYVESVADGLGKFNKIILAAVKAMQ